MSREWLVLVPAGRPVPANQYRRLHWARRADITKMWREATNVYTRRHKVPHLERIAIEAQAHYERGPLPDASNLSQTVKACIDGIVDARVVDDDDDSHIASLTYLPSVRDSWTGMAFTIKETA